MQIDAIKALNQLEAKLGDKQTVLGEPSELDCTLYAYLSIILYCLPHNNPVRMHVAQCSLLVRFVSRFHSVYLFELLLPNPDVVEEQRLLGTSTSSHDESETSKWGAKILAAAIAIGAMSLFAIKQGIFNVSWFWFLSKIIFDILCLMRFRFRTLRTTASMTMTKTMQAISSRHRPCSLVTIKYIFSKLRL